jgi:hypothetical protein
MWRADGPPSKCEGAGRRAGSATSTTSPHATMSARPPMTRLKTAEKALTEVECVARSACVSLRARP